MAKSAAVCALDQFMVSILEHFCSGDEQLWRVWMTATNETLSMHQLNRAFMNTLELYATQAGPPELADDGAADEGPRHSPAANSSAPSGRSPGGGLASSVDSSSPPRLAGRKRGRGHDVEEG